MHASMRLSMRNSYNCLLPLAEQQDQEAMRLISDYYQLGIGTRIDSVRAEYWMREYVKSLGVSIVPVDTIRIIDSLNINPVVISRGPKKSILSNRFYSFAAYTYSRFEPAGATLGFFNKFGFYLSYRTNMDKGDYVYTCNNVIVPAVGTENPPYEFARERWKNEMVMGGLFIPVRDRKLFLSVGGGRSERLYFREAISLSGQPFERNGKTNAWCYNTEATYKGWSAEIGGMWKWKKFIVLGGVNSTKFRDLDGFLSLGYSF
jgi:hypothetical protein